MTIANVLKVGACVGLIAGGLYLVYSHPWEWKVKKEKQAILSRIDDLVEEVHDSLEVHTDHKLTPGDVDDIALIQELGQHTPIESLEQAEVNLNAKLDSITSTTTTVREIKRRNAAAEVIAMISEVHTVANKANVSLSDAENKLIDDARDAVIRNAAMTVLKKFLADLRNTPTRQKYK